MKNEGGTKSFKERGQGTERKKERRRKPGSSALGCWGQRPCTINVDSVYGLVTSQAFCLGMILTIAIFPTCTQQKEAD